jgi:hypothetical protein
LVAFLLALTSPSLPDVSSTTAAAATLAKPIYWGSPDNPWGRRRPVTAADRAATQRYRSGTKRPHDDVCGSGPAPGGVGH